MTPWWNLLAAGASSISPLFALLTLVLVCAVLVSLLMNRFKQSLLVGYLLTGVVIGNFGLIWMSGMSPGDAVIDHLAEIGVILLMFTLGIEFSLTELRHMWRTALLGGGLQVAITGSIAGLIAWLTGFDAVSCLVLGIAVALSSTAVAMKSFQDMGQTSNPGARASLGVLLFQDILVILVFLLLPVLYEGGESSVGVELGTSLLKGVGFLIGAFLLGQYGLTPLLHAVAKTRSRELFTLTVIGICAGIAYAGGALDLSLALGAFAAGLVVSESIYSHRILSDILPFKDLFLAIFFVSVGLMIDVGAILEHWVVVLCGSLILLTCKGLLAFGVLKLMKLPARSGILAACSLASTGEFSLVLLQQAELYQPFDETVYQVLLICTAFTMAVVPTLMRSSSSIARRMEKAGLMKEHQVVPEKLSSTTNIKEIKDHAIICGYGPVGKALNEGLRSCGLKTLVLEMNANTVLKLKQAGQPVIFADATHPEALDLAGVSRARIMAFTFPAVDATCAAVPLARERNHKIVLFARAKFADEAERLRGMGVQAIHDERESAVALVRSALTSYDRGDIDPVQVVREAIDETN
ncbi:MAG: cation:proton antiporter [Akkermansiaceae bacterium]|nr:cation:proton antiporter [Akkermansiaceae bacterium]